MTAPPTRSITGASTYFLESDTNTDVIIPARFLSRVHLTGFEPFAFYEKRYLAGTVCVAELTKKDFVFKTIELNPDFPPNHPHAQNATFLLTWLNFGCGSSREHAVYSLRNYKVIIGGAPSGKHAFADIFRDNCRQNLIWTPVLSASDHEKLANYLKSALPTAPVQLTLDIENERLRSTNGTIDFSYELPAHHRDYILSNVDPFETAKQEIASARLEIAAWYKTHPHIVKRYPIAR